jgi:acyl carrier protein
LEAEPDGGLPPAERRPERIAAELRAMIARLYGLEPGQIERLVAEGPLFDGPLGLDSLDSMRLVIAIEERYSLVLLNDAATRRAFASVGLLAEHLASLLESGG